MAMRRDEVWFDAYDRSTSDRLLGAVTKFGATEGLFVS